MVGPTPGRLVFLKEEAVRTAAHRGEPGEHREAGEETSPDATLNSRLVAYRIVRK